jgi:hypothetical protein
MARADAVSEIIPDFANMMFTHMTTFKNNTGAPPAKIYVFRDGVSEGQYAQVVQWVDECERIRAQSHTAQRGESSHQSSRRQVRTQIPAKDHLHDLREEGKYPD